MEKHEKDQLEIRPFASVAEWRDWLDHNHDSASGLWLKIAKKSSGIATVSYSEAVDQALCYGWIDGQKASLDDQYYLQRFTPRSPRSIWSQVNKRKVAKLQASGLMTTAGLAAVAVAKENGQWAAAYPSPDVAAVPADLEAALDDNPAAKEFFASLTDSQRYAFLHWIHDARRPQTRLARLTKTIDKLGDRQRLN